VGGGPASSYYWIVLGTWPLGCRNAQGQWTAYIELQLVSPSGVWTGDPIRVCPGGPGPQAPPSPAQVWQYVPLPVPVVGINPSLAGLTQLPTWFWARNEAGPVSASANLDGWVVTASAVPVSYDWDFGDGTTAQSTSAGDESHPSVTHTYLDKGTYDVTLTVRYAGSYTFSGYGVTVSTSLGDYDQAEVMQTYTVQEARSVLVPPGTGGPGGTQGDA